MVGDGVMRVLMWLFIANMAYYVIAVLELRQRVRREGPGVGEPVLPTEIVILLLAFALSFFVAGDSRFARPWLILGVGVVSVALAYAMMLWASGSSESSASDGGPTELRFTDGHHRRKHD